MSLFARKREPEPAPVNCRLLDGHLEGKEFTSLPLKAITVGTLVKRDTDPGAPREPMWLEYVYQGMQDNVALYALTTEPFHP